MGLKALPLQASILGQFYKSWATSSDPLAADPKSRAALYGAYNDLDKETVDRLQAWDEKGFPKRMIDRTNLSTKIQKELTRYCDSSKSRRDRNRANGDCINENKKKTHGKATHGVLCANCREVHRRKKLKP